MSTLKDVSFIEIDRAGWGGYLRLTCLQCGKTLLEKRWWSQEDWDKYSANFIVKHRDECEEKQ